MGEPKQLLPWGDGTVLAAVVTHFADAGAAPVVCVIGHRGDDMRAALRATPTHVPLVLIDNPHFLVGEMLSSYQAGVRRLLAEAHPTTPWLGTLLALGDQPHVPVQVIRQVVDQAVAFPDKIVIPSYTMRRGHPFYLPHRLWPELVNLPDGETLRDLLQRHAEAIVYVNVDNDAILLDIDTPADYQRLRPQSSAT